MLRKLLLLVSLPLITFPSASFAANPNVVTSQHMETANNQQVLLSQFYPGRDIYIDDRVTEMDRRHRRRCRRWREELIYSSDFLSPRERRFQWRRYRIVCSRFQYGRRDF
jgi:hypothetical protein